MKAPLNLIYIFLASSLLFACGNSEEANTTSTSPEDGNSTNVEHQQIEAFSPRTYTFEGKVTVNGMVHAKPSGEMMVNAVFGGYISDLQWSEGQSVQRGEVICTIENPQFIDIQREYLELREQLAYLRNDYDRQQQLFEDGAIAEKVFLKAEADYKSTEASVASLAKQLEMMNINAASLNPSHISSTIKVRSPLSGVISKVSAMNGAYLENTQAIVTILDPNAFRVALKVFEKDLSHLKVGQSVTLTNASTKLSFSGEISSVNPLIDPQSRTATVWVEIGEDLPTPLYDGMFIEGQITLAPYECQVLPNEAIESINGEYFAHLADSSAEGGSKLVRIKVGRSDDRFTEVERKN